MGSQGEDTHADGETTVTEPVLELIHTGLSRDVLLWLRDEGSASKDTLLTEVATARFENVSEHDRVRMAVELEIDVLTELETHDLVFRDGDEISLGFLSTREANELETAASTYSRP